MSALSPFERQSGRERQRRETRARLFDAALAEFARKGFERASVANIAREAGVSRPTFYFHFPTKEHVLLELQWHKELEICEGLAGADSLPEALARLSDIFVDSLESVEGPGVVRAMLGIHSAARDNLPLSEQPYPLIRELGQVFERGAARGELQPGLEPQRAAYLCLTSIFGYLMASDPELDQRADLRALTALYLSDSAKRGTRSPEAQD